MRVSVNTANDQMCWHTPGSLSVFILWRFSSFPVTLPHYDYRSSYCIWRGANKQVHIHTHAQCSLTSVGLTPISSCGKSLHVGQVPKSPENRPILKIEPISLFWIKLLCSKVCTYSCCNTTVTCIEESLLWSGQTNNLLPLTSKYLTIESLQNHCMRTSTSQLVHHCGANLGCWINVCHGT